MDKRDGKKRGDEINAAVVKETSTAWAQEERKFYGNIQETCNLWVKAMHYMHLMQDRILITR